MCGSKWKRKVIPIVLLCILIGLSVGGYISARNIIGDICASEINARINNIINESNNVLLKLNVFYSDYFEYKYTDNGKIALIYANTGLINQVTLIWNTEIQNRLNNLRTVNINLSAGMVTGSALLAQFGVDFYITAYVISNCAIVYRSEFIHSGINQTLHRLIMYTEISANISIPIQSKDIIVSQETILAETLIAGDVPNSYLVDESVCDYLDLLP